MSNKLKAVSLQVTNVLGIDEITIDLSSNVTEISARNGGGKTSCIEALKSVLQSAESATLLKNGATSGKAVLVLNDGTQIINALKPGKSSKRVMFGKDKIALGQSPTRIAELFDAHSLNPVDFLLAKGKARVDLLLEAMPLDLDRNRLNKICGPRYDAKPNPDPISELKNARDSLYDLRTGDNRIAKETQGTINTLQRSLDGAQPFDEKRLWECNTVVAKIDVELKDQIVKAKQAYVAKKSVYDDAINSAAEAKLALKHAYEMECRELDSAIKASELGITNSLSSTKQQIKVFEDQSALKSSSTETEIELLEAAKKAFEGQEATRQSIKDMQEKVEEYTTAARMLTDAIDGIDAYKAALLANMPIKGLTIDGDKLMLDGINIDRVNTVKRVGVAMQLAILRAGRLKMILVDGLADIMDSKTLQEFYLQANESGCQIVTTKVTDDELKAGQPLMTKQEQIIDDLEIETPDMTGW